MIKSTTMVYFKKLKKLTSFFRRPGMDQITHDVRTAKWAEIVRSCHERPAGQSAKKWLDENGIDEKQLTPFHTILSLEIIFN